MGEKVKSMRSANDEEAIKQAVANWDTGWKEGQAQLVAMDYAEDADWLNAFGVQKKGRAEIQEFLAALFSRPEFQSRRDTRPAPAIRFIRPDVALVYADFHTVGQTSASGKEYALRKGHTLRVMAKEAGKWVIVSHFIMDEKERLP